MSGDSPRTKESVEALCECVLADIEEIAESIEEVRGIPFERAIAALCSGTDAMGGVFVVCLLFCFVATTGSDALLEDVFVGLEDGSVLSEVRCLLSCSRSAFETNLDLEAEDIAELSAES